MSQHRVVQDNDFEFDGDSSEPQACAAACSAIALVSLICIL